MYTYYPCWIQQYGYLLPSSVLPFIKNHEFQKQQTKQLKQDQQVKFHYHIVAYLLLNIHNRKTKFIKEVLS